MFIFVHKLYEVRNLVPRQRKDFIVKFQTMYYKLNVTNYAVSFLPLDFVEYNKIAIYFYLQTDRAVNVLIRHKKVCQTLVSLLYGCNYAKVSHERS